LTWRSKIPKGGWGTSEEQYVEKSYTVTGMTCDHCVRAVKGEVSHIAGVEAVGVDLPIGRLTVRGAGFADAQVRAAVDEAGYAVVDEPAA
jgi:copper chaperone